jgi:peptidoglycan hydrolase-like protein with peptidoglycan-binding domain
LLHKKGRKRLRSVRSITILLTVCLLAAASSWAVSGKKAAGKPASKSAVAGKKHAGKRAKPAKGAWKRRGQQSIDQARMREIQTALIREGYLSGEPSGVMDTETRAALVRLQQENGWQTKIVPDSRALIRLGLGPDRSQQLTSSKAAAAASEISRAGGGGNARPQR